MSVGVDEEHEAAEPEGRVRSWPRWRTVAIVLAPLVLFALLLASGLGRDPRRSRAS